MWVGAVAFAREKIKHIWKWADGMTNNFAVWTTRSSQQKACSLKVSHYIVISVPPCRLICLLWVEVFTAKKRNTSEKPLVCTLSAVTPEMRIKHTQKKPSLSLSLLSLILPLLRLRLQYYHQNSDQSVREWPTGLHRGRADLLRA